VLHSAVEKYQIYEPIPYESLTSQMMLDMSHQVKIKCKKYVVGALYEDTNHLFYSFSKKDEWIKINPIMYQFVCKHKVVIEKLNYYEWARFLERVNEDSIAVKIIDKIEESAKRNNLSVYRQILYEEFEMKTCFYCGRRLSPDKIDVDHFIPWSFIKDDNLWNLVLACPSCNRQKNDKLPAGKYLDNLMNRNQHIIIENKRSNVRNYENRMLSYVYNWAKINGYDRVWQPDSKNVTA
jgi:5-methylcytosine-specific restriction endonuclease McrA